MGRSRNALHNTFAIMIEKKHLHKMLRDILRRSRGLQDHNLMHPEREWYTGLIIAIIAIIGGGYLCLHIYWQYNRETVGTSVSDTAIDAIYREEEVARARQEFTERVNRHAMSADALRSQATLTAATTLDAFIPLETLSPTASSTGVTQPEEAETSSSTDIFILPL